MKYFDFGELGNGVNTIVFFESIYRHNPDLAGIFHLPFLYIL